MSGASERSSRRFLLACALLAAMAAGAVWGLDYMGASGERRAMTYMPDMADSLAYDAYDAHPDLPDGATRMFPPAGTIPVGFTEFDYGTGEDEQARAGREVTNPLEPSDFVLARGRQLYDRFCGVCHGPAGDGAGSVIGAGRIPNPPSFKADHARALPDGALYHIIARGQGANMASYAAQVLPEDRWRIVHYLRSLQGAAESSSGTETEND